MCALCQRTPPSYIQPWQRRLTIAASATHTAEPRLALCCCGPLPTSCVGYVGFTVKRGRGDRGLVFSSVCGMTVWTNLYRGAPPKFLQKWWLASRALYLDDLSVIPSPPSLLLRHNGHIFIAPQGQLFLCRDAFWDKEVELQSLKWSVSLPGS